MEWRMKGIVAVLAAGVLAGCSSSDDVKLERVQQPLVYGTNQFVSQQGLTIKQQSEQSLQMVQRGGQRYFLAAYIDAQNADKAGLAETITPVNGISSPVWGNQRVLSPDMMMGSPFTNLTSDPWLTANSNPGSPNDQTIVYYTFIGSISGNHRLAIAKSIDGGVNFNQFPGTWKEIPTNNCGVEIDRPSVETNDDGSKVWVAYTCMTNPKQVRVAFSSTGGTSWSDSYVATLTPASMFGITTTDPMPIVKHGWQSGGARTVYVMWQDDLNTGGTGCATGPCRQIRFARSDDDGSTWPPPSPTVAVVAPTADPVFDGNNGPIDDGHHFWFETDPVDFHCMIAYTASGKIYFTSSLDGLGWDPPTDVAVDQAYERFQPIIRATPTTIAISWYVQPGNGAKNTSVWAMGTNNMGLPGTWMDITAINAWTPPGRLSACTVAGCGSGNFRTDGFEACVMDPSGRQFFGDYFGLAPLLAPGQMDDQLTHGFYAVWADSRPAGGGAACPTFDAFTAIHQHSVGQLFGVF